ncbi:hypothetical protein PR202_gb07798 [Eleusine coracana subsp. coracana]|uniref:Uncharacterized protein n=1 Tax=Eleusine coracana subsp. coracana TaxID=191504 RepID=A0AAV5ED29_ELECO|nr:hypothetical protein PR202_gb07798 [Eleusine coracana subsp. coracana]
MPFVRKRGWRKRTVYQALRGSAWLKDIIGGLSVLATWQLIQLWAVVQHTQLQEEPDRHCWTPNASGEFTTKSAYQRFFVGSTKFEPYKRLWKWLH